MRSLQNRLVVASVLLLTLVSVVVGVAAALSLRGYLTSSSTSQVQDIARFRSDPPPTGARTAATARPPPDAGGGFVGGGPDRPADTLEVRSTTAAWPARVLLGRRGAVQPLDVARGGAA